MSVLKLVGALVSFISVGVDKCGCETRSLTLREEHKLRVFKNRVLRRIFGPKMEEDGSWRKLHDDELHSLYSSPNIFRIIK
jgi:hypothetical protein